MMETETTAAIKELANTLGLAANEIISHYVLWFVVSGIVWVAAGLALAALPFTAAWRNRLESAGISGGWRLSIEAVVWFVAAMCLLVNIPDLASPTGISIHQLLKDIRG